jgi:hypothetical protein
MEREEKYPIYEVVVDYDDESGMLRNSFVEKPAVEFTKFAFSKEQQRFVFSDDKNENMFMGVSILADTPIPRVNEFGEPFAVIFTKDTVRTILNKLVMKNKTNEITLYHDEKQPIDGIYMVESFITEKGRVESPLFDVPDGSLITTYWVPDDEKYEILKNDPKFNGFSIEIQAQAKLYDMFKEEITEEQRLAKIKSILDSDIDDELKKDRIKKLVK